ncbi:McrB family protein [Butyrivibrio sp. WCE2006]|uniref:McrB family protein n=1 Tax=Butyrivibrio sp. WCE2006 TaxID=1410611 RepID=UPI0005D17E35|nr:AAA family ATPase [Butyrivibrio sp. WCE2006]
MYANYEDIQETFDDFVNKVGGESRNIKKYVRRNYVKDNSGFPREGAYFGLIKEGEEPSGGYHDLSLVVFLSNEQEDKDDRCMVALVFGSLGYRDDYDIAALPGTKRLFMNLGLNDIFIKNDFTDIQSRDGFKDFCEAKDNLYPADDGAERIPETLRNAFKKYENVIMVASLFSPHNEDETKKKLGKFIAAYANMRSWPSNKEQRKVVNELIHNSKNDEIDEEREIEKLRQLVEVRKYVVLQGAPGTGKTRMAKKITEGKKVFFTQFHAETTYSDFIYGIRPIVSKEKQNQQDHLEYEEVKGVFVRSIIEAKKAQDNAKELNKSPDEVYLIIDEINRANLSNVLGPIFYLFEPTMHESEVTIEVCPRLSLSKLPDNLRVIATMNTADKSLGGIDFALRRRFAWYTMVPHSIKADAGYEFCEEAFIDMEDIFYKYASDEELNLMPGQAYYIIADNSVELEERLRYEVMPLIKEYLAEGFLIRARDSFISYFKKWIKEEMYK